MDIGALQVFDELQFEAFGVGEFADARGNSLPFGELRSAEAPRSGDEFKETVLATRADEDGLQDTVLADIARVMLLSAFCAHCLGLPCSS